MTCLHLILLIPPVLLLVSPENAAALQTHGSPEGIYVHQMAHALFMGALIYLYCHTRKTQETPGRRWKYFQGFCLFLIAWNLLAFTGHETFEHLIGEDFLNSNTWDARLAPPITFKKVLYYIIKMDHFLIVPALTALVISVTAVTICYQKGLAAYKAIRTEVEKLADANRQLASSAHELQKLNTNLEGIVEDRTRDLSTSEKKFRTFFENSKDIVYFSDLDGNITNINTSGLELLGAKEQNGGINFHRLFADPEILEQYVSEIEVKGYVNDLDVEYRGRDGITRHILLSGIASYDQDGRIVGYEGIGKDMTRLRTITEQLINHEKMASVGEMAAGVAHKINTPLGIILGYTQLMMDDFEKESEEHSTMEVIERQTKVCRRIVADLLKFSRQAESTKSSIDVNEIIREVLAVTEHTLNINNINIVRDFSPSLPKVTGDAEKLHQVFINLFNNSQYAMREGGDITITTSQLDENVLITVRDTGTGIPGAIRKKIFDPFFTTKEVGKGTGLGLSVTYGILQEHDGTISAESPVTDPKTGLQQQGTAFHITLPATSPELNIKEQ